MKITKSISVETSVCPIDKDPCEGANSPNCFERCTKGKAFMDSILGLKSLKPGMPVFKEKVQAHGKVWWAKENKCDCDVCLEALEAVVKRTTRPFKHGTVYGAVRKKCRCDECLKAKSLRDKRDYAKRKEKADAGDFKHGTKNAWKYGKCKCEICMVKRNERNEKLRENYQRNRKS